MGWDDVRGATLQWGRRKVSYLPCGTWMYPQTTDVSSSLPVNQLSARAGSRMQAKQAPGTSEGWRGRGPALPATPLQRRATPCSNQWVLREPGGPLPPSQNRPGLQPRATPPTSAHPSPLPQSLGHGPHLSGNVIGSLGRCVGYLGGYHHHLGSSRIHMGRGAGTGRRVTLHAGRAGGRLRPVLVEMLGERWGTASGRVPAPRLSADARSRETPRHHPPAPPPPPPQDAAPHPGTVLFPRTCGAAWVHPTQLMPGAAPSQPDGGRQLQRPEPATGRTQLGGGGSRRALHRFPALALNAGTCSPVVLNRAGAGQPGYAEPAIPPLARAVHPDPAYSPGRSTPGSSSSSPAASGHERVRAHTPVQGESVT